MSEALALYELGGVIRPAETFNVQHIYTRCDHPTPVVFILPSSGSQDNSIKGDMHFMSLVSLVQMILSWGVQWLPLTNSKPGVIKNDPQSFGQHFYNALF